MSFELESIKLGIRKTSNSPISIWLENWTNQILNQIIRKLESKYSWKFCFLVRSLLLNTFNVLNIDITILFPQLSSKKGGMNHLHFPVGWKFVSVS